MLYPVPAVLVSVGTMEKKNVLTVAWCGTVCTNPPMLYISVRPERFSMPMILETKEFGVNLTTEELAFAPDYAGVKSGRDTDKFKDLNLTAIESKYVKAPSIDESPVNIECRVKEIIPLGSHTMLLADILGVTVDSKYMDESGKFDLKKAKVITYSHGEYYGLGEYLGKFGYSVKKKK
jgi:flavin reductase (DIM6/NTAB) family NADH-FMN oxidoreductase RutF